MKIHLEDMCNVLQVVGTGKCNVFFVVVESQINDYFHKQGVIVISCVGKK